VTIFLKIAKKLRALLDMKYGSWFNINITTSPARGLHRFDKLLMTTWLNCDMAHHHDLRTQRNHSKERLYKKRGGDCNIK